MSERKYTPGSLAHTIAGPNHWLSAEDGRMIAFIGGNDSIFTTHPNTPHKANATRLAECWNVCSAFVDPQGVTEILQACKGLCYLLTQLPYQPSMQEPLNRAVTALAKGGMKPSQVKELSGER